MNYGYIRISKDSSDTENQVREIQLYAEKNNLTACELLKEVVSGKKSAKERQLGKFIEKMQTGDLLIVSSISRLGRDAFDVMATLKTLIDRNVKIIAIQENREFSNNLESQMFASFYALFAAIERDFIIQRTKAGLARSDKRSGRPKDSVKIADERQIKAFNRAIDAGENRKQELCKLLGMTRPTLNKFLLNNPELEKRRAANQPSARKSQ